MRKLYILIFALSLFTGTAFGQMVKGHVYDAETHEPLPGVNITYKKINGDTNGTISDADGAYEIALPDGGIDLLFSYIGYENEQLPLILRKGDTKTKDVYMNIKTNLLGDVVVSAGRFEQKLSDVTVSMDLLKAGDIAKQAPTDLSSTLNTMPGVDINDKQPSIRGGNGWTYGVGSRSLVLVDGMSALSSGNGVINWNIVPLENIEQVEVMKGASSVLYGSSALNGVINIRTKRPGLTPTTSARAYVGVYDHPVHDEYEGADVSHARRIGNFDVSGGLNLFSDDGYRDQGYNRRLRLGGNMTYHHPMKEGKLLNYGFNFNYLADKYADFFIWRSPVEVYQPSSIANMGRKGNTFYIDPFFNFTNPTNNTSVDGMSALSSGNGVINWNIVPLENIEQVEVMKGASSVLYGSSALNGVINIRTKRPGLTPTTSARAYVGVYDHPVHDEYEGADVSHARRIGNFDVSGGLNLFSDDGYRDQGYNRRLRLGGNMTYHHPMKEGKLLNYGFNFNYLADKYADFFIWRSPVEVYQPSSIANMGRKGNTFYIDPFFNFTNPTNNTSHKIKTRFYYRGDNIIDGSSSHKSLDDILGNMGSDAVTVNAYIDNIKNGDYSPFFPLIQPILQGDLNGIVDGAVNILNGVFPTATTADYCDLISWVMNNNKENVPKGTDKNYTYYVDYQFNKKWDSGSQITAGATYEHMKSVSKTTGTHDSDNAALFVQYDQRFFDRLSVSAGMRAEYYRVDGYLREADTKLFGTKIPVKPIFRAGLNYQLADYSFIRASFGQGYRYPSLTEKYARKDIGGVGVYPNKEVNAEKGVNAELGFKQGYKFGNLTGFFDLAGFYTQYTDMIEFRFGIFNNTTFQYINGVRDLLSMITQGQMPGFGAQFYNVSKARIYGAEVSTNGVYTFNPNTTLSYNLGYVFIEPEDADYKKKNEEEATYDDPMQMKEKSNTSKYLKYRQKHTVKAILDFQWKRLTLGTNIVWKSKTLAVDYLMVDERAKEQPEIMDYVRDILFGNVNGQTLHSYWAKNNTPYCVVDLRAGVKIMKGLSFQFMVNNLFNKEYSTRPMLVSAPRTYVMQLSANF